MVHALQIVSNTAQLFEIVTDSKRTHNHTDLDYEVMWVDRHHKEKVSSFKQSQAIYRSMNSVTPRPVAFLIHKCL
jgi:ribonuclease HI